MLTPFSVLEDEFFPIVQSEVARRLLHHEKTQREISMYLGVTQAMISKYANQSMPKNEWNHHAQYFADKITALILAGASREEVLRTTSALCISFLEEGRFEPLPKKLGFSGPMIFSRLHSTEREDVMRTLRHSVTLLEQKDLSQIFPQVRMNIAMITEKGTSVHDVASFPGRLSLIHGIIRSIEDPEFGASHHLSQILLDARKKNESIRAVANIKYQKGIEQHLRKQRLSLSSVVGQSDCFIDHGGFGIEPQVYVLGSDAVDVVKKIVRLL